MTQQEKTGVRELNFSSWIREKLPASETGMLVSDLDFCLYNYKTKKFMMLEIKTRSGQIKTWQRLMFKFLNKCFIKGKHDGFEYLGWHLITFENIFLNNGKTYFDNKEITEQELIKKLSF